MTPLPAHPARGPELRSVLERMSAHLDRLSVQVFDLEKIVATHVTQGGDAGEEAIQEFQTLDFLRQSLEDISILVLLIAKSDPETDIVMENLHRKLKLESTKAVLLGADGSGFETETVDPGEMDLF